MAVSKKIIFTVTNDLTFDQRMQKICISLSNAGYEIELIGRQRSFSLPLSAEFFKQTRLKCFFNKGKLFYLEYNLRLLAYLLFQKFDALCAIDLDTIVPVYIAGKMKGSKLIYDAHEYFTEVPEVIRRPSVKGIWEWVEKTFVPKFDLCYTVSPALAELFSKKHNRLFHIIRNVPLLDQTSSVLGHLTSTILYQGALNEGRGLEHLIEAMRDVNAKLLLAGEGDLSDELRNLTVQLNLENKVEFCGFLKPTALKELTAKATIGINLLENKGLSYYYSLSNKFFDYIHAGIPQICIAFPEYKTINDKYEIALLVETCSVVEIKEAIARLLGDDDLYKRLQKKCEVCARELNWQSEERKLVAFYDELFR